MTRFFLTSLALVLLAGCGGSDSVADKAVGYLNHYCTLRAAGDGTVRAEIRGALLARDVPADVVDTMSSAADRYCRIRAALDAEQ
jgi:hypothetical protein